MENNNSNTPVQNEYEQHAVESGADYKVKSSRFQNVVAKVLCVLAAIVLWFYVVGTDTAIEEKKFTDVPIDIKSVVALEDNFGLSVISGYDYTVDLTVSGANADISRLSLDDVSVFVDVSHIEAAGEYSLEVKTSLPNGVTVSAQSSNYIQVYVDKRTSISVPVVVEPMYSMESTYELGEPEPSITMVNVSGPAVELEKIKEAKVTLDLGRIDKTLTATGKLVLVDASGAPITNPYIKLQSAEVSVKIPVYTYKDVPLAVTYKYGYYNSTNVDVKISPASIRVKGEPSALDNLDSIVVLQLDEKKIVEDGSRTATIMLPDNIENVSGIRTADIKITHKGTDTRDVVVSNLSVVNTGSLRYTIDSPSIVVKFRGTRTLLSLLNQNNVTATIDLGYLNNSSGTVSVPVTISVSNTLSGSVYEIGEYEIDVTIH